MEADATATKLDVEQFLEYRAHELALKYAEIKAAGAEIAFDGFYDYYTKAYSEAVGFLDGGR